MNRKNFYILLTLSFLTFIGGVHKCFVGTGLRADIFIFFDHINSKGEVGRYVSLIIYEMSYMFSYLILLFICRFITTSKNIKNIISPFIWIASIDIIDYICFYKQLSYIKLPLLVILVATYNKRWIYKGIWTNK